MPGPGSQGAHDSHNGPLAYSQTYTQYLKDNHQNWGDIIPPFDYYQYPGIYSHYSGQNYSDGVSNSDYNGIGQAMLQNECNYVTVIDTVTAPTFIDPTCLNGKEISYTITATNGVKYYVNGAEISAGKHYVSAGSTITITATATTGNFIKSSTTKSWTHTFSQLPTCLIQVASVMPTFTALTDCSDKAGSYVIPDVVGVNYKVRLNGGAYTIIPAGTYYVTNGVQVDVLAEAKPGYVLSSIYNYWSKTFDKQTSCGLLISAVTFVDETCQSGGYITIPDVDHVTYYINDTAAVAGDNPVSSISSVTVTISIDDNYYVNSGQTTTWSHQFNAPTNCVLSDEVTFVEPTCDTLGYYVIPPTDNVKYYLFGSDVELSAGNHEVTSGSSVKIIAYATDGYEFLTDSINEWSYQFSTPTDCGEVLGDESVTPTEVIFTPTTCSKSGSYTIPEIEGVTYYINGEVVVSGTYEAEVGQTIVVTALANEGYELKDGAVNQWSYTFKAALDCNGKILGDATTLPTTSSSIGNLAVNAVFIIFSTMIAGLFVYSLKQSKK